MYQGKFVSDSAYNRASHNSTKRMRRLRWRKEFVILLSVVVLLLGVVGGTLAYLATSTEPVVNTFTPAKVGNKIEESFENNKKTNVCVTNSGDIPVYVRATISVYWKNDSTGEIYADKPAATVVDAGNNQWMKVGDIYYYTIPVESNATTPPFISSVVVADEAPADGFHLVVDVLSESIQAKPVDAVQEAWNASVDDNGVITSIG